MTRRFIGRWADRTASKRLCRPYRILFCCIPLTSVAVFFVFKTDPSLIDTFLTAIPEKILAFLRIFDGITLPRSLSDLDAIDERLGTPYFQVALTSETLLALGGVSATLITLIRVDTASIDDEFSVVQFWIRVFIVICCLVLRPVRFSNPALAVNYVDKSGLFLLKEGAVIAAGYYHVALILTDALGRLMSKVRGPAIGRRPTMQDLQEHTEL